MNAQAQQQPATADAASATDNAVTSNTVTSLHHYTVHDWDAAIPLMQAIFDETSALTGTQHYDWTKTDNEVLFRSSFEDAETCIEHFENQVLTDLLSAMVSEGVASQDKKMSITGPTSELSKIMARADKLDAEYFDGGNGFQAGYVSQTGTDNSQQGLLCSSHPTFKVTDWDAAAPLVQEFIDRTALEEGCVYFGWASKGDDLSWHGNYASGEALRRHFANVRSLIEALDAGPANLTRLELHGPAAELDKARTETSGLENVVRYETEHRVKRLAAQVEKAENKLKRK